MRQSRFRRDVAMLFLALASSTSAALAQTSEISRSQVQDTGISGLWVLANISFAGMRAQNSPSTGWRVLAFLFGLPGTIVTYFAVHEGSNRAYGIDLPDKRRP